MSALPQILLTGAAATGAAALAVPAARNAAFGRVEHDWMAGEIELDRVHADRCTVQLKGGDCFRVIAIEGLAYDARPASDVAALAEARAEALGMVGNAGLACRLFAVKRRRSIAYDSSWPTTALARIGEAERRRFATSFEIHWRLVVQSASYARLDENCKTLLTSLARFGPSVVHQAEGDSEPCPLTSFLHYLVGGGWGDSLPAISANLSVALPGADVAFGRGGRITTHAPSKTVSRVIAIRAWPESVSGEFIGELLTLPADIEICQTAIPLEKPTMTALFRRKGVELATMSFFGGREEKEEYDNAVETLSVKGSAMFDTQLTVTIGAGSGKELESALARATEIMGRQQVSYSVETVAAAGAWFNRIPGHEELVRPLKLFNTNIGGIWPFHNAPSGQRASPHGAQPVRLFGTESGQSYRFQFHTSADPQARGHYLVLAPTGGGKTTLILHLLAGLARYEGVRSYIFDSREGARFTIEALGGRYHSFENLALNPLDTEDTPEARQRINLIVRSMLGEHADDDGVDDIVGDLLEAAFKVHPPDRTFNAVFEYAFPKGSPARSAFAKWVAVEDGAAGLHAHVFNAHRDGLAGDLDGSHMVGINMNEALSDETLAAPVVTHIASAVSQVAAKSARGFNIFIDEAAALIRNEGFRQTAEEMYREYRKLNGCVGMAFQEPAALHRSGAAETIIENTATLIIFPNAMATEADYAAFKLNDEHMAFITGNHTGRKVLVVRRDGSTGFNESAILDVDLSWLGDSLGYYRSGVDAVRDLMAVQHDHPDDWMERL